MARILFLIVKFLPFWALPVSLIAFEVAYVYKRRGRRQVMLRAIFVGTFFIILTVLYFVYRWDKNAMPFIRDLFFSDPRV